MTPTAARTDIRPSGAATPVTLEMLITPTGWVMMGLLTLGLAAYFWFFFYQQHLFSSDSQDWSHAYFIPVISGYMIWRNRAELAAIRPQLFWPGLLPFALGFVTYPFMVVQVHNHMVAGWALILCIFGLTLLLLGPALARRLVIPIGYLFFAVTISEMIMGEITFRLQLLASSGAYALLNIVGVSASVNGNNINIIGNDGSVIPLDVAQQCSGMRMVIAFCALGVAVAVVGARHWWQRVALVLLAVPVALAMNVVRVAVLGIASLADPDIAKGGTHMLIGTILLVPAFFLYMGIVWLLNRAVTDEPAGAPAPVRTGGEAGVAWWAVKRPAFVWPLGALIGGAVIGPVLLIVLGIHLKKLPVEPRGDRKVQAIPAETASWARVGTDVQLTEEMVVELGTSNYLTRSYQQKNPGEGKRPRRVELHLAYYTGMIDTVPHVPDRCLTGAGWSILSDSQVLPLNLDSSGWMPDPDPSEASPGPHRVARVAPSPAVHPPSRDQVRLPRDPASIAMSVRPYEHPSGTRMYGGYFFIANGGHCPTARDVRLLAFKLQDDYAYYLKVQVMISDVASLEEYRELTASLVGELLPEIMRCAPDWTEVERGEWPPDNPRRAATPAPKSR